MIGLLLPVTVPAMVGLVMTPVPLDTSKPLTAVLVSVPPEMVAVLMAPVVVRPAKVGLEVVAMFWMVLITPLLAEKFVLLKVAMPLVRPSAAALLMVTALPMPLELLMVRAPVRPSKEVTPLPLVAQVVVVHLSLIHI